MTDKKPDYRAFCAELSSYFWECVDVDAGDLVDYAIKHGLVREIPGGFDPDEHADSVGVDPEPGDPWYEIDGDLAEARRELAEKNRDASSG